MADPCNGNHRSMHQESTAAPALQASLVHVLSLSMASMEVTMRDDGIATPLQEIASLLQSISAYHAGAIALAQ